MKQYILTVSENQMRVIMIALEDYFRTRMGQYFDLSNDVAKNGYEYDKNNPDNGRLFNEYIWRRDEAKKLFEKAYTVAAPDVYKRGKTPDVISAIDIWSAIRYQRWKDNPNHKHWTVDSREPYSESGEPLIQIEVVDE